MIPAIVALQGTTLTDRERGLLRDARPAGVILFNRNVTGAEQVRRLIDEVRAALDRERVPVMADQEGGRVQILRRGVDLGGPLAAFLGRNDNDWVPEFPAASSFGRLYAHDPARAVAAAHANARLLGRLCHGLGISVALTPVLDLPVPGAHRVIGDRALAPEPEAAARLGRAVLDGLWAEGVAGCVKHAPGHGRAAADSHAELPVVEASRAELEARDLWPFRALADAPWVMTAHVAYADLDPGRAATESPAVIGGVLRSWCGMRGVIVSDALEMQALRGTLSERAARALAAGCDVALSCSADPDDLATLARTLPPMTEAAAARLAASVAPPPAGDAVPEAELRALRDAALG